MSITRLQQARQMYSTGQRVAKTLDGSRPGYRGDAAYGPSSRSSQATSIGQARGATGKGGGASLGGGRDKNEQPAQQFIGGKSYDVTPTTRDERDRATLKQQILNQTTLGGNRIDKYGNTKKSPFRQGGGLGSLLMGALGMFTGIPGLGLITGGLRNLQGGLGSLNRKMRGVNPDGTTRTQAQYEQARYNRQQQKRLDKLFAAKDRGYNQIGFGDFTKKTMDFTPGQQAKIDELMALGYMPSTARNVDSGRGSGLRGDINNLESLVAASQMPQGINLNDFQGYDLGLNEVPGYEGTMDNKGIMGIDVGYPSNDLMAAVSAQDLARYSQQGDLTRATDYETAMDTIYSGSEMTPYEYEQLQKGNITEPGTYTKIG